jgi:hypothetical protein
VLPLLVIVAKILSCTEGTKLVLNIFTPLYALCTDWSKNNSVSLSMFCTEAKNLVAPATSIIILSPTANSVVKLVLLPVSFELYCSALIVPVFCVIPEFDAPTSATYSKL